MENILSLEEYINENIVDKYHLKMAKHYHKKSQDLQKTYSYVPDKDGKLHPQFDNVSDGNEEKRLNKMVKTAKKLNNFAKKVEYHTGKLKKD